MPTPGVLGCTSSRRRWATRRAALTTTSETTVWSSPTPTGGSCSDAAPGRTLRTRHHPPAAARVAAGPGRVGRTAGCGVGTDGGTRPPRAGAGVVRLPRAGPAVRVDRICSGGVRIDAGRAARPRARLVAARAGRRHGGRNRGEGRRGSCGGPPAPDRDLADDVERPLGPDPARRGRARPRCLPDSEHPAATGAQPV